MLFLCAVRVLFVYRFSVFEELVQLPSKCSGYPEWCEVGNAPPIEGILKLDMQGRWDPRVVNRLGKEVKYQNGDTAVMYQMDAEQIKKRQDARTAAPLVSGHPLQRKPRAPSHEWKRTGSRSFVRQNSTSIWLIIIIHLLGLAPEA
jgi:hypothetical protein